MGKSTFAGRLQESLNYEVIELDTVVNNDVITPLGLDNPSDVFIEVYRNGTNPKLMEPFIRSTQQIIAAKKSASQPVVLDGAVANPDILLKLLGSQDNFMFLYFHPANLAPYVRNITSRFDQANNTYKAGLPKRFWSLIDPQEFKTFVQTGVISPALTKAITSYAISSQAESQKRLTTFQKQFKNIVVVEI